MRHTSLVQVALASLTSVLVTSSAYAQANIGQIDHLDLIGQATFATNTQFSGTNVGGLSGLTYDRVNNRFYAISDDRSSINPARFYTLTVDLSDGALNNGDVAFTGVTTITQGGVPFATNALDPEGIALSPDGTNVYITSEGQKTPSAIQPFVNRFSLATGDQNQALTVPNKFAMTAPADTTSGPRNNLVFETAAITPSGNTLFTAMENALQQDGPAAAFGVTSPSRLLSFDLATGNPGAEYLYNVDSVVLQPEAGAFNTNGLCDILFTSDTTFLALERSFTANPGHNFNEIRIYQCSLDGATDISGVDDIDDFVGTVTGVQKTLLLDLTTLPGVGAVLDNIEGLAFGPTLPDGSSSLIVVSDNNFSATQSTQFLAFKVTVVPEPGTFALAVLGLLPLAGLLARRKK